MAKRGQILRQTSRQTPLGPTKESKMGAPSPNLCNPLAGFSAEKRLELPAVEIMARSLVVKGVGRTKFETFHLHGRLCHPVEPARGCRRCDRAGIIRPSTCYSGERSCAAAA